ncbi:UNVERIFIED_CONTAM: hypothetical protein NCL1_51944 [Trichonephila clavipes]
MISSDRFFFDQRCRLHGTLNGSQKILTCAMGKSKMQAFKIRTTMELTLYSKTIQANLIFNLKPATWTTPEMDPILQAFTLSQREDFEPRQILTCISPSIYSRPSMTTGIANQ